MRKFALRVSPLEDRLTPATFEAAIGPDTTFAPFPGYTGTVGLVTADVDGDGREDAIQFTADSGGQLLVRLAVPPTDVTPGHVFLPGDPGGPVIGPVTPFEPSYQGGLNVSAGDLDGDGKAEIVVAPKAGGSGRIEVLRYDGSGLVSVGSFLGIEDANFRGGATVAVGDFDADGRADVAVGAGPGGGPRVAVYAGTSTNWSAPEKLREDFFGLDDVTFRGGVSLASADFDSDGKADLAVGAGPGGAPRVTVHRGGFVSGADRAIGPVADFFANLDVANRGGVALEVGTRSGETGLDLVATVPPSPELPESLPAEFRSTTTVLYRAEGLRTLPAGASPVGAPVSTLTGFSVEGGLRRQFVEIPADTFRTLEPGAVTWTASST